MDLDSVENASNRLKEIEESRVLKELDEGDSSYIKERIKPAKDLLEELANFLKRQASLENVEAILNRLDE